MQYSISSSHHATDYTPMNSLFYGKLYFWLPPAISTTPTPTSGNHQSILCDYELTFF